MNALEYVKLDAIARATAARRVGNIDHAAYWTGYSLGTLLAQGRGPQVPQWDWLRGLLTEAQQTQFARRGDVEQTLSPRSQLTYITDPEKRYVAIQASGMLEGWYGGTLEFTDADECGACGERVLRNDPAEEYADCDEHGCVHLSCARDICGRCAGMFEWDAA